MDPKTSEVGGGREGVEVHVRRIVSAWSKSPSQVVASRDLSRASGSDGMGEGPRESLERESGVWMEDDMVVISGGCEMLKP